ncbi:MAG: hypothetical protein ABSF10_16035 [Verrucomicrobiota bacterium]|jgi:hypothetical protein
MSDDTNLNREEKAVDALITGALHSWSPKEATESEINEFLSSKVELSDSEKAALKRVHEQFQGRSQPAEAPAEFIEHQTMESPYMAMNRENATDQIPTETREEIEKKRAALLAQLKAKKRPPE